MIKDNYTDLLGFATTKRGKLACVAIAVVLVFSLSGIALAVDDAVDAIVSAPVVQDDADDANSAGSGENAEADDVDDAIQTQAPAADPNTEDAIQDAATNEDPQPGPSEAEGDVSTATISISAQNCAIFVGGEAVVEGQVKVPLYKSLALSVQPNSGYVLDYVVAQQGVARIEPYVAADGSFSIEADHVDSTLSIQAVAKEGADGVQPTTPTTPITDGTEIADGKTPADPVYAAPLVTLQPAEKEYDALTMRSTTYLVEGLQDGDELVVTHWIGSQTDVGSSSIDADDYVIWRDGVDVTSEYQRAQIEPATLTVNKAQLVVSTPSKYKHYDGEALVYEGSDEENDHASIGPFYYDYEGPAINLEVTGSQTEVGSSDNTYTISPEARAYLEKNHVITDQLGTLTVLPAVDAVYFIAPSASKTYDGTPLVPGEVSIEGLPEGFTASAKALGSITDVGTVASTVDPHSVSILDRNGNDATANLPVEFIDGVLSVERALLYIHTFSDYKDADGTPLTADGAIAGLAEGDTLSFRVTGSQTDEGSSVNTYELLWNGTAKESNYEIVEDLGTLQVYPAPAVDPDPAPEPEPEPAPAVALPGNDSAGPSAPAGGGSAPSAPGYLPVASGSEPSQPAAPAIDPAVEALATGLQNIEQLARGEEPTDLVAPIAEETLEDAENPLGVFDEPVDCWVHWYALVGIIATAVYGGVVMFFRRAYAYELETREAAVLGVGTSTGGVSQVPSGERGEAGRRA